MIVAIHQPQYLPWLGYFNKINQADIFCFLDNVQYKKNEWQNRNRIKTVRGWQWLTVPVHYRFGQKISEVTINARVNWRRKHFQAIRTNYAKAPFFNQYIDFFEEIYQQEWQSLCDLNIHLIQGICGRIGIPAERIIRASALDPCEDPTGRLIDICRRLGADTYLAGSGGAGYMDLDQFAENGINVLFQNVAHPVYPQRFGGFTANLSVVDLLMNCGPESRTVIGNCENI